MIIKSKILTDTGPVESTGNKNQSNGYAGLDGSSKILTSQLPDYTDTYEPLNNYLAHGFETNETSIVTYADTPGTIPEDGTGGSANVIFTLTDTDPLKGGYSALLTKDAVNRQGEGFSVDFTISEVDKGRSLSVLFDYIVVSGTFVAGDISSDGDVTVYVYDVTNSKLIYLSDRKLYSNSSSLSAKYIGLFQTSPDSVNYRLIIHCGSTSASAYTLKFDEVRVSPLQLFTVPGDIDWTTYSLSIGSDIGSTPSNAVVYWGRKGNDLYAYGSFNLGTVGGGTDVWLSIPFNIDISKVESRKVKLGTLNRGTAAVAASGNHWHLCYDSSLGDNKLRISVDTSGAVYAQNTGSGNFTTGELVTFRTDAIPIVGWGSSIQSALSGDDGRVIVAKYFGAVAATASTSSPVQWNTLEADTHNCVTTGSGWKFTAPISAWYEYTAAFRQASTNTYAYAYKNGVVYERLRFLATDVTSPVTGKIYLKSGEYFDIRTADSVSIASETECSIAIAKIAGNAVALGFAADMALIPKAWGIIDGTLTGTNPPTVNKGISCSVERTAKGTYEVTLSKPVSNMCPIATALTLNDGSGSYGGHAQCVVNSSTKFTIYCVEIRVGWSYEDANPIRFFVYGD